MKTILVILLLCSLWSAQGASAQSGRSSGLAIKVVAPVIIAGAREVHVPLSPVPKDDPSSYNGKWKSMRLNAYDFTKWNRVRVSDTKIMRFFSEPDATSTELGKVKLSSTTGKQLIFFMGNQQTKNYRVFAVKNSEVEWGEYAVFNSTGTSLMFQFEKSKKVVKPQAMASIKPPKDIFEAKVYTNFGGKVKQIKDSRWRLTTDHREFIFCLPRPNSQRIRWVHVRDSRQDDVFDRG